MLSKRITAASVGGKVGMPICCDTGAVLRIANGGFISPMEKPSCKIAYGACLRPPGKPFGSRLVKVTRCSSIAFGFASNPCTIWLHWNNAGSRLLGREYCPHCL